MDSFNKVKELINFDISDDVLIAIAFEMSRFYDGLFTKRVKQIQKDLNVIIDSPSRKQMRKKFYYGSLFEIKTKYPIESFEYKDEDIEVVFTDCFHRLETYDADKIIDSMKKRQDDLAANIESDSNMERWLNYYNEKRKKFNFSLAAIKIDQKLFEKEAYDENVIIAFIREVYESLENYRYLAIVVDGELYNKNSECVTWNMMYKAGIYAENFVQYSDHFFPFHKNKQVQSLSDFLYYKNIDNHKELAEEFYSAISTGYRFEDCYVSDKQGIKIMIYKKIELDENHVPCPSCNTIIQSGNSYPEMFLRSWECKNPSCPDRSKSGRGKRFDEYGTYRYFKLVENKAANRIDQEFFQKWRRDVFPEDADWIEFLLKKYSYENEKVLFHNIDAKNNYGRIIIKKFEKGKVRNNYVSSYYDLPIVKLFVNICAKYSFNTCGEKELHDNLEVINANSTDYLQLLKPNQIGSAITSPPYYNAREYSQWGTLIMYYVDMLLNAKAVINALKNGGYYLYNIGDIVSEDNVYVVSNMSKHRVQLGFLSCLIFEIAGFTLTGNLIWDKGEVQSKRSSTVNMFTGYVKCINCYEHLWVFRKGKYEKLSNTVHRITPVIKINSKGENTYKHTAPYPLELVELIKPYVDKDLYVLDPFLGSGTTVKWCRENGLKGVGFELNKEYYQLCRDNIFKTDVREKDEQMNLFDY